MMLLYFPVNRGKQFIQSEAINRKIIRKNNLKIEVGFKIMISQTQKHANHMQLKKSLKYIEWGQSTLLNLFNDNLGSCC